MLFDIGFSRHKAVAPICIILLCLSLCSFNPYSFICKCIFFSVYFFFVQPYIVSNVIFLLIVNQLINCRRQTKHADFDPVEM